MSRPLGLLSAFMFRAVIEFLVMIGLALLARAVLRSVLSGIGRASSQAFASKQAPTGQAPRASAVNNGAQEAFTGGELHKDPVCGTYVAENSSLKRQISGRTFYYCSENCREKHTLAAR